METKVKARGLTGNQLKLLAMLLMTVDHLGMLLFPQEIILRHIGRLAMPVFAFMVAEGCRYTKSRVRYLLTMAGFGFVCQVFYWVFMKSLNQCIFVTFTMSIVLIYAMDHAAEKKNVLSLTLMGAVFGAVTYICHFLPGNLPGTDFSVDYGLYGVFLPVMIYLGKNREQKLMATAMGLALLSVRHGAWQWPSLLAVPLLALYNGQRGKRKMKYLFYIYYPVHLVVIYGIGWLLFT